MNDNPLLHKLLCVGLVASVMVPLGRLAFPLMGGNLDGLEFSTIEAAVSALLGFGLYIALFG